MNTPLPPTPTDWLDLAQADREGPFSRRFLWRLISNGQLTAFRPFKKKVLIRRSDLTRLIEGTRIGTDPAILIAAPVGEMLSDPGLGNR